MDPARTYGRSLRSDHAISPVVGTILMVAATVALAATVLTVMNGFGDSSVKESSNAVFKVQVVDTNSNGNTDQIKVTYVSGPSGVPATDVFVTVKDSTGAATTVTPTGTLSTCGTPAADCWKAGDFRLFDVTSGTWFVTISVGGSTVYDDTVKLDE